MTTNAVREGVMGALNAKFPDTPVYGEQIKQGFTEPCFFVKLLEGAQEKQLGRRRKRHHTFDIHYFGSTNAALHDMADQLYTCLEYIEAGGALCRGTDTTHEIVDGVLHFFVQYKLHVMSERPADPVLQSLEQRGGLR
jgi:hypothetical protein